MVFRIVYNTALTHINTSVFNTEYVDYMQMDSENSVSDWNILEEINERERKNVVNKTMERMPKDESLLLTLYYLEENSVKDICLITALSESNVKVKLHRARKRFGEIITMITKGEMI